MDRIGRRLCRKVSGSNSMPMEMKNRLVSIILMGIISENTGLLPVTGIDHVIDGLIDPIKGKNRDHRSELLFVIHSHLFINRV